MAILGGITEVRGFANSLEIKKLALFAIDDYNKKQNLLLEFKKVVNAKEQVVEGMMYYLTLEVKDGDKFKVYEAKVWEKLWMNLKQVEEFKLLGDAPTDSSSAST